MRLLLFLSLTFVVCVVPVLSQETSDREKWGYKGPVKSVRTKSSDDFPVNHEIIFDRDGRLVEQIYYTQDGKPDVRLVYTYDAGGRTEERYNQDGKLLDRVVMKVEFDKARGTRRTTFTGEVNGNNLLQTEMIDKYDSLGRLLDSSSYNREGKLQSRSTRRYGADGGLEEFVLYNEAGSVLQRHVQIPEGMRISLYGKDGTLVSTEIRRRQVCEESDQYGNCKRGTTARSITKDGKVEEVTHVSTRTFTYY